MECKTYRFYDHVGRDFGILQRDEAEIARWRARDPIKLWRQTLIETGVLTESSADAITVRIGQEMDAAIAAAEQDPDPLPEDLFTDVYTES